METPLFNSNEKEYGNDYKNHFFEQYKFYQISSEKTSDRRHAAIKHCLGINAFLIAILNIIFQNKFFNDVLWLNLVIICMGIFFSICFWFLIRSYKQLNTGKFYILHKIESQLPLNLYKYEWEILGKGKNKKKYYPFSEIELFIPWICVVAYVALAFMFICSK